MLELQSLGTSGLVRHEPVEEEEQEEEDECLDREGGSFCDAGLRGVPSVCHFSWLHLRQLFQQQLERHHISELVVAQCPFFVGPFLEVTSLHSSVCS